MSSYPAPQPPVLLPFFENYHSDPFTAGTVKTSMNHPTQGNTQMFRRNLDDAGFQQVCAPLAHRS